jgi:cobalt-zinc-cadmium efflux system protein
MHVWTLDGEKNYLTIHAMIDKKLKTEDIIKLKKDMKELLKKD